MKRRLQRWAIFVLVLSVVELACAKLAVSCDLVAGLTRIDALAISEAVLLLASRLLLYLVVPGWALYLAALAAIELWSRRRE